MIFLSLIAPIIFYAIPVTPMTEHELKAALRSGLEFNLNIVNWKREVTITHDKDENTFKVPLLELLQGGAHGTVVFAAALATIEKNIYNIIQAGNDGDYCHFRFTWNFDGEELTPREVAALDGSTLRVSINVTGWAKKVSPNNVEFIKSPDADNVVGFRIDASQILPNCGNPRITGDAKFGVGNVTTFPVRDYTYIRPKNGLPFPPGNSFNIVARTTGIEFPDFVATLAVLSPFNLLGNVQGESKTLAYVDTNFQDAPQRGFKQYLNPNGSKKQKLKYENADRNSWVSFQN